jgi:hypothetical protein
MKHLFTTKKQKAYGLFSTALAGLIAYLFITVPPENPYVVIGFIFATGLLFLTVSTIFLKKIHAYLLAVTTWLFLTINYFAGFQIVTTILLISFIIGIAILLERKHA